MSVTGVPTPPEQDENRNTCGPHCGHWDDMQELDRLRAAVNAWVDAEDALGDKESEYEAFFAAKDALRKAVGR